MGRTVVHLKTPSCRVQEEMLQQTFTRIILHAFPAVYVNTCTENRLQNRALDCHVHQNLSR